MRLIILIGLSFFSFESRAMEATWVPVQAEDAVSDFRITGHVIPQDGALHIESARVQGRVTSILRREGETVNPKTPILSISSAECLSLREEKKVAEERSLPELVEAVQKRESQLGLSVHGDECQILAQNRGTITKRNVENGSAFNAGDPLMTILETGRLSVELDLPEQAITTVKVGQKVQLELASNPGVMLKAKIQNIVPTVDPTNRTIKVRIGALALPKTATLDSLVFGEVDTGTKDQILVVPTAAIVFDENKNWVVKNAQPAPIKVAVQVVSERETTSAIRPLNLGELKTDDMVAGSGAIYFFKK